MISLFLDTASTNIVIAIYRDLEEVFTLIEKNDNHLSERLLPNIKQAFQTVQMKITDIDRIYVVNGPGSFTGVRIGVTVAKTIAWALKKDIVPISELEFLATTDDDETVVAMIDARREYVYAGIYDKDGNIVMKDQYISIGNLQNNCLPQYKSVSYDTFSFPVEKPTPDVRKIIERHYENNAVNCHQLNPNYLKITEAEANRVG